MKKLTLIVHPLIKRDLTILRDKKTQSDLFRNTLRRISTMMAMEATQDIRLRRQAVRTPMGNAPGFRMQEKIVIVPVLRAGLGMVEGFLELLPDAKVGHIGLYRDETTLRPVEYYLKLPGSLRASLVFLLDPMLATGGSASASIALLKRKGAKRIRLITLLAAREGVRLVHSLHPDIPIFTTVVDTRLNDRGYIVPGLGDAGDRIFGTD